jgi:hypothetical protein
MDSAVPRGDEMKLKLDDDGNAVLKDGKPVYESNGKDIAFDAPAAVEKIKDQAETLDTLEKSTSADAKKIAKELAAWDRLGDIKEVRKAVQTVAGLSEGDIDAAQLPVALENLTAERDTLQQELGDAKEALDAATGNIRSLTIGNAFANEPWIRENLIEAFANEPAMLERIYGSHFENDGGKIVAKDSDGKPILSVNPETHKARPASFAEALNQLVGSTFRKPSGAKGSDAAGDSDGPSANHSGVRTKADLKTQQQKTQFITDNGLDAFQALPMGNAN